MKHDTYRLSCCWLQVARHAHYRLRFLEMRYAPALLHGICSKKGGGQHAAPPSGLATLLPSGIQPPGPGARPLNGSEGRGTKNGDQSFAARRHWRKSIGSRASALAHSKASEGWSGPGCPVTRSGQTAWPIFALRSNAFT
jgi:hypothetical protein